MNILHEKEYIYVSIILSLYCACTPVYSVADVLYFNPAQLENIDDSNSLTNLSIFEDDGGQNPGRYNVDIYVNDEYKDTKNIYFQTDNKNKNKASLKPCLSIGILSSLDVNTEKLNKIEKNNETCMDLELIPGINTNFDFSEQRLMLTIPQVLLIKNPRGYSPDTLWDDGISAILLNYGINGAKEMASERNHNNNQFINLRPGVNFNSWQFRNYTTWQHDNSGGNRWNTIYSYLQRNIRTIKSQLTLGDSNSSGDIFESVSFRGLQLSSDDDMLPESIRGYAPIVRGIAETNSKVLISQNGSVIYQTYVSPGVFEINDIYPTGSSGDLQVDIEGTDGSKKSFIVPFASSPIFQREGRLKFSLIGGYYNAYDNVFKDKSFVQSTAIYGLSDGATVYGGYQVASNYKSLSFGIGKNLGNIGAISTDVTQSWSKPEQYDNENGQSLRIRYSKNFSSTGTNFTIAGYRYSTSGYATLQETLDSYRNRPIEGFTPERTRNRIESNVEQTFSGGYGGIMLSFISEDYWEGERSMRSLAIGYHNAWKNIDYGLNYNYSKNTHHNSYESNKSNHDHIMAFNISIPLNDYNAYASYNINNSQRGGISQSAGISGSMFADNRLNWSVQQEYRTVREGYGGNLNASYRGGNGNVNLGYSYNTDSKRISYGLQGGIVAHSEGITLGQPLGDTLVLVQAKGAKGLGIDNQAGVNTDQRGYAIIPYVSPYRKNVISLNTETMSSDVDIMQASTNVVPTRGAVVKAEFDTRVGKRILMTLNRRGGAAVPFGALVTFPEKAGSKGTIVADDGQVYLTGMAEKGKLLVTWGEGSNKRCLVDYNYSDLPKHNGIQISTETCN